MCRAGRCNAAFWSSGGSREAGGVTPYAVPLHPYNPRCSTPLWSSEGSKARSSATATRGAALQRHSDPTVSSPAPACSSSPSPSHAAQHPWGELLSHVPRNAMVLKL